MSKSEAKGGASMPPTPMLDLYGKPVRPPEREVVGREQEVEELLAALARPEIANALLLGDAGSGKSTIVAEASTHDPEHYYIEIDVSKMVEGLQDTNVMAARVKDIFDEAEAMSRRINEAWRAGRCRARSIVLFIDEIHQLAVLSPAAIEAMKPVLAGSALHMLNVIAATTYDEFRDNLQANLPFVERFCRIDVHETTAPVTVSILEAMAGRYDVEVGPRLLERIVELTDEYVPAAAQPRKSITILDSMIGWHRRGRDMNERLLEDVLFKTHGVRVSVQVDARDIRERLDAKVLAQGRAVDEIDNRLQICMADLNDRTRPMASFLFTGSTGVGKALANGERVPIEGEWRGHREKPVELLEAGRDRVLGSDGRFHNVLGVFPQGMRPCLTLRFSGERYHVVSTDHVFTVLKDDGGTEDVTAAEMARRLSMGKEVLVAAPRPAFWKGEGKEETDAMAERAYEAGTADSNMAKRPFGDDLVRYDQAPCAVRMAYIQGFFDGHATIRCDYRTAPEVTVWDVSVRALERIELAIHAQGWHCERFERRKQPRYTKCLSVTGPERELMRAWSWRTRTSNMEAISNVADRVRDGIASTEREPIRLVSASRASERPCTCIKVDAPDSLFLTSTYVPTHNTEMCKQLAGLLFEDPRAMIRFDMSEFALDSSYERFRQELTDAVWVRPNSVVLLDEIEKAAGAVTRVLLQVLDDGRLTDRNGRVVPFTNAYIVLTTNAASGIYRQMASYHPSDDGRSVEMTELMPLIQRALTETIAGNRFPPELLGRINAIVPFQPLSDHTRERICRMRLEELAERVRETHRVDVAYDDDVVDYLVYEVGQSATDAGGAREVVKNIDGEVSSRIARAINESTERVHAVEVGVEGVMQHRDPNHLKGSAHVEVRVV